MIRNDMVQNGVNRMEKLILIDGNSIIYRAFYALPLLSNSNGLHTNAVYGFTTMLLRLIEEEKPTHFLVAFDAGKVTFRHKDYKEYKGGRAKMPPELSEQFPLLKELLKSFRISQFELEGFEADDIIGTLTRLADEQNKKVLVVTGDKDMLQLASDNVTIALTRKGISEVESFDPAHIHEVYGLAPKQIIDLKGLMGDASDNIPGIPGVGEKTALKLLHQYGTVEDVLAHSEQLSGKMRERIEQHADDARLSKELATIYREVPVHSEWDNLKFPGFDGQAAADMFRRLEFKSLLDKMDLSGADEEEVYKDDIDVTVVDVSLLNTLAEQLSQVSAIHIEAVGENPHLTNILGIALHTEAAYYYVPFDIVKQEEASSLRKWLADETAGKCIYDVHRAEIALSWHGIGLKGSTIDVLLAAYLLDPTEANLSLSGLARKYAVPAIQDDEEVFGKGAKFQVPEIGVLSKHLARKAAAVHRLAPILRRELEKNEMNRLYYDLELPLASVLAQMEKTGIVADVAGLKQLGVELAEQLDSLVTQIYEMAGTEFNIGSPKQLGEILFDKLGLPVIKKTKTGYSTDAEVLEKLEPYHEIVAQILHYRQLSKLQSTYVEGLLKEVRPETNKIHTFYKQTITATGRLSSQFPNLQNIPIRLEEGRKIRKVFVPAEQGWHILAADYSQIELRVLAHISQDEKLIEAFLNNMDIHTKTAMDVFGVSEGEVDGNMRRQAKAVNFGIVYGISDYGLSQNLNITRKEAAEFIDQYFSVFKGVRKFMDDIVMQARKDGYVTTLLQRRRYLPEITASNFNLRSFAERTAMNSPIQGTAADIIKLAMVQLAERMEADKVSSRMLLQVHDELVLEVPEEELPIMAKLVKEVMEDALKLDVPLKVDVSHGKNWYEAK
jgi:DNA polymerase-1